MATLLATPRTAARRAVGGAFGDLRRPGAVELAVLTLATVVLAGVALAGGTRATGGPTGDGLSMAVDTVTAGGAGATELTISVDNGTRTEFAGTVTASSPGGRRSAPVDVPAGATGSVRLTVPGGCGTAVTIVLDGPGGAVRHGSASASCDRASGG